MFKRFREALSKVLGSKTANAGPVVAPAKIAAWAGARGLTYAEKPGTNAFTVSGRTGGLSWRIEHGAPSRTFIRGTELRGRTELGLHQNVAVLVINRHLKEALEHHAFAEFTDTLRTVADAQLPEEMRWLSMYDEVAVPDAPIGFHDMYAVHADEPVHARMWLDEQLATEMMRWPKSVNEQTPIILMALRGNVYLRMETAGPTAALLEHAVKVFPAACLRARAVLPGAVVHLPG